MNSETDVIIGENARILIRSWRESDARLWLRSSTDEGLNSFTLTNYRQSSEATSLAFIQNEMAVFKTTQMGRWPVIEKVSGDIIGLGLVKPVSFDENPSVVEIELGYRLVRSAWGQGIATEVAKILLAYGFHRLRLPKLIAFIERENEASLKILKKIGMSYRNSGHFKNTLFEIHEIFSP